MSSLRAALGALLAVVPVGLIARAACEVGSGPGPDASSDAATSPNASILPAPLASGVPTPLDAGFQKRHAPRREDDVCSPRGEPHSQGLANSGRGARDEGRAFVHVVDAFEKAVAFEPNERFLEALARVWEGA